MEECQVKGGTLIFLKKIRLSRMIGFFILVSFLIVQIAVENIKVTLCLC